MQSVSLCDQITLSEISSGIQLSTNHPQLATNRENLAYQAAELFLKTASHSSVVRGVKIDLEKNIPLAAGLGGGSADAAAVLYGLNQMGSPEQKLSTEELSRLGAQIGSDVPFCLIGGTCLVKGRGEQVAKKPLSKTNYYVLVVPGIEISTRWAYAAWDEGRRTKDEGRWMRDEGRNDLEAVVISKYPIIQKVKDKLLGLGCGFAQMSGSGPSVFGFPANEKIRAEMAKDFPRSYLLHPVEQGVELQKIA
jgi:4-diphosphocytidyl-2-C-methyl-D-erythritol kinase